MNFFFAFVLAETHFLNPWALFCHIPAENKTGFAMKVCPKIGYYACIFVAKMDESDELYASVSVKLA
jgi:hypothetical protein